MKCMKVAPLLLLAMMQWEYVAATAKWYASTDGSIFFIENEYKYNWFEAWNECARKGLQLVAIEDAVKNAAIVDVLKTYFGFSPNVWTSATDQYKSGVSRPFFWSATGNKMSFTYWMPGEPNNLANLEHCVYIWGGYDYRWNDAPCDTSVAGYICEVRR